MPMSRLFLLLWLCALSLFAQPSHFVFAVVADPQVGWKVEAADREQFVRVAAALNALRGESRPAFLLLAGDLLNSPKSETQVSAVDTIRKSLEYPQYSIPGNHDPAPEGTPGTFSFVHQDCLFLGLDSNAWVGKDAGAAEKQLSWLESQLRQRDKYRLVFILQHHPLYLHDPDEKDDYYNTPLAWRPRLLKLIESARVTACIFGHLHGNKTILHRGISMLVMPSSLANNDATQPGFGLIEVNSAGFVETYVPVVAKP
jgi:serine/threonine-protein phosphatase CPPED1